MPEGLNPGDKVVALAAAATTAAVVSGMAAGAVAFWTARHTAPAALVGAVGGAGVGSIVGRLMARRMFPASEGRAVVARWGPGSLPLTLRGNLAAGLTTSLAVCALSALNTHAPYASLLPSCFIAAGACSALLALLASLW